MRLRVKFTNGTQMEGVFTDYTYADDNEEEIASINLKTPGEPWEYSLLENEIQSIELA